MLTLEIKDKMESYKLHYTYKALLLGVLALAPVREIYEWVLQVAYRLSAAETTS